MKLAAAAFAAVLLLGAALPAGAEAAPARDKKKTYDPDEMICVNRPVTGSRLQRVRQCHTAREWEEVRMQEKVGLMRRQYNGKPGDGAASPRDSPW
jgi:hypothetical protein